MTEKELINQEEMSKILDRISFQIAESGSVEDMCIVGIQRRGVPLAERIHECIKKHQNIDLPFGTIDITLYRDDLSEIAAFPKVYGTDLNFDVTGKTIILVDDVIYTGRTARAALECIIDFGRPAKILFVTLVDRGHRELPIQPDFTGKTIPTSKKEIIFVKVTDIDGIDSVTIGERSNGF